jgi:hypothetical protein
MVAADYEGQSTKCGPQHTQVGKAKVDRPACGVFEKNIRAAVGVVGQSFRLYKTLRPMNQAQRPLDTVRTRIISGESIATSWLLLRLHAVGMVHMGLLRMYAATTMGLLLR